MNTVSILFQLGLAFILLCIGGWLIIEVVSPKTPRLKFKSKDTPANDFNNQHTDNTNNPPYKTRLGKSPNHINQKEKGKEHHRNTSDKN